MSTDCDASLLARVSIAHLEEAAFLCCDPLDEPPPWPGPTQFAALLLDGQREFAITVTTAFAHELAATLLGMDADNPLVDEKTDDALGELLNMLAGVVTEEMAHGEQTAQIGIPTVGACDEAQRTARTARSQCATYLLADDEHRIDLTIG